MRTFPLSPDEKTRLEPVPQDHEPATHVAEPAAYDRGVPAPSIISTVLKTVWPQLISDSITKSCVVSAYAPVTDFNPEIPHSKRGIGDRDPTVPVVRYPDTTPLVPTVNDPFCAVVDASSMLSTPPASADAVNPTASSASVQRFMPPDPTVRRWRQRQTRA